MVLSPFYGERALMISHFVLSILWQGRRRAGATQGRSTNPKNILNCTISCSMRDPRKGNSQGRAPAQGAAMYGLSLDEIYGRPVLCDTSSNPKKKRKGTVGGKLK